MFAVLWRKRHRAVVMNQAHGLVGHGDAPVLSEGCEPLISGQDVPLRYRVGCVASRSKLPRERFSPLALFGHDGVVAPCPFLRGKAENIRSPRVFRVLTHLRHRSSIAVEPPMTVSALSMYSVWQQYAVS